MIFDAHTGEFIRKNEYPTANKAECIRLAGEKAKRYINKQIAIQTYCVTDDHYIRRSVD